VKVRDLEGHGPAAWTEDQCFAVEDGTARRNRLYRLDELGYGVRHVVERTREHADLAVVPVDLYARAVELVFERRIAEGAERLADLCGAVGEHRAHRVEQPEPETATALAEKLGGHTDPQLAAARRTFR
jgi:hypothetical protein